MSEPSISVRLKSLPELGARMPGWVPRAAFAVVSLLLCIDRFSFGFWFFAGALLTAVAIVVPRLLAAWGLVLLLGVSQAFRDPSPWDWHFFVLLAGLHLLHVVAAQTLALPLRGWVQLAVFRRPILRYLALQPPAQLVAFFALLVLAPSGSGAGRDLPVLGVVGAAALLVVTAALIVPLLRERARTSESGGDNRS